MNHVDSNPKIQTTSRVDKAEILTGIYRLESEEAPIAYTACSLCADQFNYRILLGDRGPSTRSTKSVVYHV